MYFNTLPFPSVTSQRQLSPQCGFLYSVTNSLTPPIWMPSMGNLCFSLIWVFSVILQICFQSKMTGFASEVSSAYTAYQGYPWKKNIEPALMIVKQCLYWYVKGDAVKFLKELKWNRVVRNGISVWGICWTYIKTKTIHCAKRQSGRHSDL